MDSIVRFLGENYLWFDRCGTAFIVGVFAAWAMASLAVRRLVRSSWARATVALVFAMPAVAAIATTLYVRSRTDALIVPAGYAKSTIVFRSGDGAELAGELLFPTGPGRAPAVVFLVGSDVSSYRTNYGRMANEVISVVFAASGYAILYFDKRGIGGSGGDWTTGGIEARADDAGAALDYLAAHPRVDPARLGVAGHSQGGWVAQLVASRRPELEFMMSLAGPATGVEEQIADDEANSLICDGATPDDAARQVEALLAGLRRDSKRASEGRLHHFALIAPYRPDSAIRRLAVPALFLFAANDDRVPSGSNTKRLREILGGSIPPHITLHELPGAGHSLRVMPHCFDGPTGRLPFAAELIPRLREWLAGVGA
jgi:alpha/beta superfamily hydrolase